jgi:hypothetical protein
MATIYLAGLFGTGSVAGGTYTGRDEHHQFPKWVREQESASWGELSSQFNETHVADFLDLSDEVKNTRYPAHS